MMLKQMDVEIQDYFAAFGQLSGACIINRKGLCEATMRQSSEIKWQPNIVSMLSEHM